MNKMFKRLLSMLLAITMVISGLQLSGRTQEARAEGGEMDSATVHFYTTVWDSVKVFVYTEGDGDAILLNDVDMISDGGNWYHIDVNGAGFRYPFKVSFKDAQNTSDEISRVEISDARSLYVYGDQTYESAAAVYKACEAAHRYPIYLKVPAGQDGWALKGQKYTAIVWNDGEAGNEGVEMYRVDGEDDTYSLYCAVLQKPYNMVDFWTQLGQSGAKETGNKTVDWSSHPSSDPMFIVGTDGQFSYDAPASPYGEDQGYRLWVDTDMMDFLNDERVVAENVSGYAENNQGKKYTTDDETEWQEVFTYLNAALSAQTSGGLGNTATTYYLDASKYYDRIGGHYGNDNAHYYDDFTSRNSDQEAIPANGTIPEALRGANTLVGRAIRRIYNGDGTLREESVYADWFALTSLGAHLYSFEVPAGANIFQIQRTDGQPWANETTPAGVTEISLDSARGLANANSIIKTNMDNGYVWGELYRLDAGPSKVETGVAGCYADAGIQWYDQFGDVNASLPKNPTLPERLQNVQKLVGTRVGADGETDWHVLPKVGNYYYFVVPTTGNLEFRVQRSDGQPWVNETTPNGYTSITPTHSLNRGCIVSLTGFGGEKNWESRAVDPTDVTVPLYFGNLSVQHSRYGHVNGLDYPVALKHWSSGANISLKMDDVNGEEDWGAVAQGLVGEQLNADGQLVDPVTGKKLPYLSGEDIVYGGKTLTHYYKNLQFPFKISRSDDGVITYSYDSAKDAPVFYNFDTDKFYEDLGYNYVSNENSEQGNKSGFYPLNKPGDNGDAKNYGFGTKFTIPFKVSENGKLSNGKDIVFSFTGDDDVWVFIDGNLVLDMGGGHKKASGRINFATQKATVDSVMTLETYNLPSAYQDGGENDVSGLLTRAGSNEDHANITAYTKNVFKDFSALNVRDGKTHTLTMFYMERGMWDSNMSIYFNMEVVPSGLSVVAEVNDVNVNPGLKELLKKESAFDFKVETKDGSSGWNNANSNVSYQAGLVKNNITEDGKLTGLPVGVVAQNFKKPQDSATLEDDAFTAGWDLRITELPNAKYSSTTWTVVDQNGVKPVVSSPAEGENKVSEFDFDATKDANNRDTANYAVKFVNDPILGSVVAKLLWEDDVDKDYDNEPADFTAEHEFKFVVEIDGDGDGTKYDYEAYENIGYRIYNVDNKESWDISSKTPVADGTTSADGSFTMKVGQVVEIWGVPIGMKVRVRELTGDDLPAQDQYNEVWNEVSTGSDETASPVSTDSVQQLLIKNRSLVNDVFYVEAGQATPLELTGDAAKNDSEAVASFAAVGSEPNANVTIQTTDGTDDNGIGTKVTFDVNGTDAKSVPNEVYTFKRYIVEGDKATTKAYGKVTIYTYKATPDLYVFDYGLSSDLANAMWGNGMFANDILYNQNATTTAKFTGLKAPVKDGETDPGFTKCIELEQSQIASSVDVPTELSRIDEEVGAFLSEKQVWFTPTAFMDEVETFYYETGVYADPNKGIDSNHKNGVKLTGQVKVMPASIVYYEDNFTTIQTDGAAMDPGDNTQSNGLDIQYGYDASYGDDTVFSNGTYTQLASGSKFVFKFKGTGFDILTNTANTNLLVYVYDASKCTCTPDATTGKLKVSSTAKALKTVLVNASYESGSLNQIPLVSVTMDGYGEYVVMAQQIGSRDNLKIDGVRVYNPLTDSDDRTEGYTPATGELDAVEEEVRNLIFGKDYKYDYVNPVDPDEEVTTVQATLMKVTTVGNTVNKIDFANGSTTVEAYTGALTAKEIVQNGATAPAETSSLLNYAMSGPNNELYLTGEDYVFGTAVSGSGIVQIGMKLIQGGSAQVEYLDSNKKWVKLDLNGDGKNDDVLKSSMEMYYRIDLSDVWNADGKKLILLRAKTGTIALTKIKHNGVALSAVTPDNLGVTTIEKSKEIQPVNVLSAPVKASQSIVTFTASADVTSISIGVGSNELVSYDGQTVDGPINGTTVAVKTSNKLKTFVVKIPEEMDKEITYTITTATDGNTSGSAEFNFK